MNTLTNRLRAAREYADLGQTELAIKAGISRATISAAENGHSAPSSATITVWALACGVDACWLSTGRLKP
ncbi:helix-turn-helix transcriptional regulator [Devriesea agamarum]|uniref:helix-turn-helix transcriptional regulator n=1 Tax=Devriesea agamarum TaxID=472569 RepID=UPI0038B24360